MPLTRERHLGCRLKPPLSNTSDVIIRVFSKRGRSMRHRDVQNGTIDLMILLRIGSKLPFGAHWSQSSARLPTMVAVRAPMNKPRTLICSNDSTHRHPLPREVPNKGQMLLGISFPIPELLQLAVMIKPNMSWGIEPLAVQNSQDLISQVTGGRSRHPPPESGGSRDV